MLWKNKNYSFEKPICNNGDEFESCNIVQLSDRVITDKTGLIFTNCNLTNCILPSDAIVNYCNISKMDFCYWLHPNWDLPTETENCKHVMSINVIETDSGTKNDYVREDTHGVG